ncbi:MAG: hypothetical protein P8J18_05920 [Halieaceae bacterium]|nr:hypothetical protein [Halieaceae bacterium]
MIILLTSIFSLIACWIYIFSAKKMNWIDYPNVRSAHSSPVISGGGIAIYAVFLIIGIFFSAFGEIEFINNLLFPLLGILVVVGFIDDISGLKIFSRLVIYFSISCTAIFIFGSDNNSLSLSFSESFFASLCFCLFINLYNFMDGIDGLLATNCIISLVIAVFLLIISSAPESLIFYCSMLASVQVGFLIFNWAPAKLFMGDAGSIPTGFLMGAIAIETSVNDFLPAAAWVIIFSPFLTDSLGTLILRLIRLENIFKSHSSHMYQRLARHWDSHKQVVFIMGIFQCFWCAPIAYFVTIYNEYDFYLLLLTYVPLLLALLKARRLA